MYEVEWCYQTAQESAQQSFRKKMTPVPNQIRKLNSQKGKRSETHEMSTREEETAMKIKPRQDRCSAVSIIGLKKI